MSYVFGIHAVESVLVNRPHEVICLFLKENRSDKRKEKLHKLATASEIKIKTCSTKLLDEMVLGNHQGAIVQVNATFKESSTVEINLEELNSLIASSKGRALILILDGITDPQNLGACLRTSDAAGVTAVIIPKNKSVGITPVVRKVACGAAEVVPVLRVTNLVRLLDHLKKHGVWIYGASEGANEGLYDLDLKGDIALVLGSEAKGLRRLTQESCDSIFRIPMAGSVTSLNVSVAAGICLFESVRQRESP